MAPPALGPVPTHRDKIVVMVLWMLLSRGVVAAILCGLLVMAPAAAEAKGKKKTTPQVKLFTAKQQTTQVPALGSTGIYFERKQEIRAKCGKNYVPLSLGVVSATNPLAAQDLGGYGVGVFVSGAKGSATTTLQVLCVRGGRTPYYDGFSGDFSGDGQGSYVGGTLSCKSGYTILGAPFSQGHAPAVAGATSLPDGTRRWMFKYYLTKAFEGQFAANPSMRGYPRATCVRATGVNLVEFTGTVSSAAPARGTASCKRGRILGWGAELWPQRRSPTSDGGWVTPTIERAQFMSSRSMAFSFVADGQPGGFTSAMPVRAKIVCGTLPKG